LKVLLTTSKQASLLI